MNRGREWRHAINDKKSSSSSSSTTSSPSDVSFSPPTSRSSSTITSLASSPSDVDDEHRSLLRQYSEEEAQSSSSPFLRNVLSNTILYSVQNQDFLNTKMILEYYQNDVDYDLRHHNWVSFCTIVVEMCWLWANYCCVERRNCVDDRCAEGRSSFVAVIAGMWCRHWSSGSRKFFLLFFCYCLLKKKKSE